MTKKVVNSIKQLPENQRFMKGIFAWVGYKTTFIEYTINKRQFGNTTFNFYSLLNFAILGLTSFSVFPLRLLMYIGLLISILSFIYAFYIIIISLLFGITTAGFATIITIILFLGGIQLIGLGILGEYIGKIYLESKKRPIYIVEDEY